MHASIRLLVVEDAEIVRLMTSTVLERAGFEVLQAADGQAGLDLARQHLPDLVITDQDMPRLSGLAMVQAMRTRPELADIPVMMMTGDPDASLRAAASEAGIECLMGKPVGAATLIETVNALLRQPARAHAA
jgi:two-component system chemotaxis response regulator CheY